MVSLGGAAATPEKLENFKLLYCLICFISCVTYNHWAYFTSITIADYVGLSTGRSERGQESHGGSLEGWHHEFTALGDTHPSDATDVNLSSEQRNSGQSIIDNRPIVRGRKSAGGIMGAIRVKKFLTKAYDTLLIILK